MPASHATISPPHSSPSADSDKGVPMAVAIAIAIVSLVITTATAKAAVIASDNAGNTPYTSGQTFIGQDGGTGFGTWIAGGGSVGTALIASGPVFNVTAGAGSGVTYTADRTFDAALNQGETFSTLINLANPSASGDAAILLYAGGTDVAEVFWNGSQWRWNDGSGGVDTGVTSLSSLTLSFTRTGSVGYAVTFGSYSNAGNLVGGSASAAITEVGYRAVNGTSLQISNLQVVPEPSTYAMLIAGGLAMGAAAIRRRRRARR